MRSWTAVPTAAAALLLFACQDPATPPLGLEPTVSFDHGEGGTGPLSLAFDFAGDITERRQVVEGVLNVYLPVGAFVTGMATVSNEGPDFVYHVGVTLNIPAPVSSFQADISGPGSADPVSCTEGASASVWECDIETLSPPGSSENTTISSSTEIFYHFDVPAEFEGLSATHQVTMNGQTRTIRLHFVAAAPPPDVKRRALILYSTRGLNLFQGTRPDLIRILRPRYDAVQEEFIGADTPEQIGGKIRQAFREADDDDISLIYWISHGQKINDGNDRDDDETGDVRVPKTFCKRLPCDEQLAPNVVANNIGDDDLNDLFGSFEVDGKDRFNGPKILMFEACFSGGLVDGTADLSLPNTAVMMAAGTNQKAAANEDAFGPDPDGTPHHGIFGGSVVAGLARDEHRPEKARADRDGDDRVTVRELFAYLQPKVIAVADAFRLSRKTGQTPAVWPGQWSDATAEPETPSPLWEHVVLEYEAADLIEHPQDFTMPENGEFRPVPDQGGCACEGAECRVGSP